jgi:SpoVK/Ycf46/Vps4 family AAA+-type ATPase
MAQTDIFKKLPYIQLMCIAREAKREKIINFTKPWVSKKEGIFFTTYINGYDKSMLESILKKNQSAIRELPSFQRLVKHKSLKTDELLKARKAHSSEDRNLSSLRLDLFPGVAGLNEVKRTLIDRIYMPFTYPERAKNFGVSLSPGILFYGPPGNGKTFATACFCEQCGFSLSQISATSLMNKYFGETEAKIRMEFQKAAHNTPTIIFIDEVDAIMPNREKLQSAEFGHVNEFLVQLDGVKKRDLVAVIGTTNRREALDPAIIRAGRLDQLILVDNPADPVERQEYFEMLLNTIPCSKINFMTLAELTQGTSFADIKEIVSYAGTKAFLRFHTGEHKSNIMQTDLVEGVKRWEQRTQSKSQFCQSERGSGRMQACYPEESDRIITKFQ